MANKQITEFPEVMSVSLTDIFHITRGGEDKKIQAQNFLGDSVLIDAQISPFRKIRDTREYREEWSKWRLILDGKEHFSKFKNYEEWEQHYNKED